MTTSADFNISFKDMKMTRKQLPQTMLGALSKREEELLKVGDEEKPKKVSRHTSFLRDELFRRDAEVTQMSLMC